MPYKIISTVVVGLLFIALIILLVSFALYLWLCAGISIWGSMGDNAFMYWLIGSAVTLSVIMVALW